MTDGALSTARREEWPPWSIQGAIGAMATLGNVQRPRLHTECVAGIVQRAALARLQQQHWAQPFQEFAYYVRHLVGIVTDQGAQRRLGGCEMGTSCTTAQRHRARKRARLFVARVRQGLRSAHHMVVPQVHGLVMLCASRCAFLHLLHCIHCCCC